MRRFVLSLPMFVACAHPAGAEPVAPAAEAPAVPDGQEVRGLPVHPVESLAFSDEGRPKNVVLVIGDGMGLQAIQAAMVLNGGSLWLTTAPHTGLLSTACADRVVTDSAAAATAMATGHLANYRALGLDASGRAVDSLLDRAEARGLATGLVTTSPVTHATPAAFYAHQADRASDAAIARDLLGTGVDLVVGGGGAVFSPGLRAELAADELPVLGSSAEIATAERGLLFLADGDPPPWEHGRGDQLSEVTAAALEGLSRDPDGFFLMVEGAQIDWGGHRHDARYLLAEILDLDRTLRIVLEFAHRRGDTLVVAVADHEVGGVSVIGGDPTAPAVTVAFGAESHTAAFAPAFAWGPGSARFAGVYPNTQIHDRIVAAWAEP